MSSPLIQHYQCFLEMIVLHFCFFNKPRISLPSTQVDGVRFFLTDEGIQLIVIDGHHGKVVDRVTFKNSILQGIPAQIENYVNNIKDQ